MIMSAIRKSEVAKMNKKELEAKLADFGKAMLELEGEGKRDKVRPLKKAIARIKTRLSMPSQTLNTGKGISSSVKPVSKGG